MLLDNIIKYQQHDGKEVDMDGQSLKVAKGMTPIAGTNSQINYL